MKKNHSNSTTEVTKMIETRDENLTSLPRSKDGESIVFSEEKCSEPSLNVSDSSEDTAKNDGNDWKSHDELITSSKVGKFWIFWAFDIISFTKML